MWVTQKTAEQECTVADKRNSAKDSVSPREKQGNTLHANPKEDPHVQ